MNIKIKLKKEPTIIDLIKSGYKKKQRNSSRGCLAIQCGPVQHSEGQLFDTLALGTPSEMI